MTAVHGDGRDSPSHAAPVVYSRKLILAKLLFFATAMASVGWQRFQNIFYLEQGLSPSQIGELKSLGLLLKFFGEPFWCLVADLTDMKTVFAFCILMQISTMELLRLVKPLTFQSLLFIKILRTTTAPATTFTTMASFKLTEGTREGYGQQRLFGSLAWGLGAFVAGYFIDTYGMVSIFYYTYFFNFIAFLIVAFALQSSSPSVSWAAVCRSVVAFFSPSSSPSPSPGKRDDDHEEDAQALLGGASIGADEEDPKVRPRSSSSSSGAAKPSSFSSSSSSSSSPSSSSSSSLVTRLAASAGSSAGAVVQAARSYIRMVGQFTSNAPCRLILLNALCYGVVMQVPDTFLFISLEKDFKASKSFSGFCTTVSTLSAVPLFWYSQALITRYGHHNLIFWAQSLAVLRLVLYSFLWPEFPISRYLVLCVQLLHGFNFALFWSASVDAIFKFAPKDLASSSMALLNMVYFTGGGAVGSLVWGPSNSFQCPHCRVNVCLTHRRVEDHACRFAPAKPSFGRPPPSSSSSSSKP